MPVRIPALAPVGLQMPVRVSSPIPAELQGFPAMWLGFPAKA